MVAPVRELANTLFPSPSNHQSKKNMSSNSLKVAFDDDIDMDEDKPDNSPGNVKLEYKTQSQNHQVSKAADSPANTRQQCAPTADPTLNISRCESVFNVQLNYDPDTALDPDSWDRNFHAVSLHGSMEHLASDVLNIKESLTRMQKFIAGKSINGNKANNLQQIGYSFPLTTILYGSVYWKYSE